MSATRPQPLDRDQRALLAMIAHGTILTIRDGARWSISSPHLQERIETLGARGLLTTEPVRPDVRQWRLSRHGQAVHRSHCTCSRQQRQAVAAA